MSISLSEWKLTTRAMDARDRWEEEQENLLRRLLSAIDTNDKKAIEALLRRGAPLNVPLNQDITALGFAASKDNVDMMTFLMNKGASVTTTFAGGKDAAWLAAEHLLKRPFFHLMNEGARPNLRMGSTEETRLMSAVKVRNPWAVEHLLTYKAIKFDEHDRNGWTALHHNLRQQPFDDDDLAIFRMLLAAGADVNAVDDEQIPAHALADTPQQKSELEGLHLSKVAQEVLNQMRAPDPDDQVPEESPDFEDLPVPVISRPRKRL